MQTPRKCTASNRAQVAKIRRYGAPCHTSTSHAGERHGRADLARSTPHPDVGHQRRRRARAARHVRAARRPGRGQRVRPRLVEAAWRPGRHDRVLHRGPVPARRQEAVPGRAHPRLARRQVVDGAGRGQDRQQRARDRAAGELPRHRPRAGLRRRHHHQQRDPGRGRAAPDQGRQAQAARRSPCTTCLGPRSWPRP